MELETALKDRKSIRVFKPDPVSRAQVEKLLSIASLSPSGTNVQPWNVYVAMGPARERLTNELLAYRESNPKDGGKEWPTGDKRVEPYVSRMRTLGKEMYTLLEIPKGDKRANWNQFYKVTKSVLEIPDNEYVVCGMSLGFADETAAVNTLVSEREPVSSFAIFHED